MKPQKPILLFSVFSMAILLILFVFQVNLKAQKSLTSKELYQKYCASCHGPDGRGVEKMAKMLKTTIRDITKLTITPELSKEWQKVIKEGKGKMPAYKTKLKEPQMDSVFTYMRAMTMPAGKTEGATQKDTTGVCIDTSKK